MKNTIATVALALGTLSGVAHAHTESDAASAMPSSMLEFINWSLDRGACGSWTNTGVTEDMWEGVPAGIEVTNTHTTWYDVPTQQLFNSHHMETADGRVISTGSNVMTWDAERKVVVSAGSGFDMGKPYHGSSFMTGMTDNSTSWEYTELSRGKTTVYEHTLTYVAPNVRTNSFVVKGDDGKPWVTTSTRTNPAGQKLEDVGLVGSWDVTEPDGTIYRDKVSWVGDKHVLKYEGMSKAPGGEWRNDSLFVWYWDPAHDHVATLYLDYHGTVIHGKVDSIARNGDSVTIVSSHEGNRFSGLTMSTQMTQVVTDKTVTTTFQGMALDGMRHPLSWSEGTQVSNRVD